ncbi:hypothetical protein MIND_01288200 [Mycena indigotica]|uniref:Uncharacterized protein n=1 Tax=Mycena indigotica TaxID=2126181 RepID=A0A8H6S3M2_9AGAR|nr:uncharacterized protein MIND_01288200 [Mycena indigotica]KAF7291431.1 hypothetical protein MIND_01288200 [Mycena indigotica]
MSDIDHSSDAIFPPELEYVIFKLAAAQDRGSIPRLMLVAWRVKEWIEPLMYQPLLFDSQITRDNNLGLLFPFERLPQLSPNVAAGVKSSMISIFPAASVLAILGKLPALENVFLSVTDKLYTDSEPLPAAFMRLPFRHLYRAPNRPRLWTGLRCRIYGKPLTYNGCLRYGLRPYGAVPYEIRRRHLTENMMMGFFAAVSHSLYVFRHIWCSPRRAKMPPKGPLPANCNARLHKTYKVTPAMIAYACVQARTMLSSSDWNHEGHDGLFDYKDMFKTIVSLFEEETPEGRVWAEETLGWWQSNTFGVGATPYLPPMMTRKARMAPLASV